MMWFKRKDLKLYRVTYQFMTTNYTTLVAAYSEADALLRFEGRHKILRYDVLAIEEVDQQHITTHC